MIKSALYLCTTVLSILLVLPAGSYAQEASLAGTVTDTTSGVLPGVTITAIHEATGNTFNAVTDERGGFRLLVRIGTYRVTAELLGFATVTRSLQLLVGQEGEVNFQLAPANLEESVTVTGDAPLIDVSTSTVGGNIDAQQISELPVSGRNWMELTLLAPGARTNSAADQPVPEQGAWQLNVDGQQVTQMVCCGAQQPRYSRDAIAEFEFISNRFDATQGRSAGVQVNVVTKSGTNTPAGTFSAYFRDDKFNAEDFIEKRVLPYSNQQISATFGGPIRRDRIHYFANYEFEREPQTFTYNSPFPSFNIDQSGIRGEHKGGLRTDFEFTARTRLSVRAAAYHQDIPYLNAGGAALHPSSATRSDRNSKQLFGTLTQVLSDRAVNQIKAGYASYDWFIEPYVIREGVGRRGVGELGAGFGTPRITFSGYAVGTPTNLPQALGQQTPSIRDDFSFSYNASGRHDVKMGAEYLYNYSWLDWCSFCNGSLEVNNSPIPANIEEIFPVWNDFSTWRLDMLSPLAVRYRQAVGTFDYSTPRHIFAGWFQNDWHVTNALTLNLGIRYDFDLGGMGENIALPPFESGNRPSDKNNLAPRTGFAYSLNDATVLRGGYGLFFTQLENDAAHQTKLFQLIAIPETNYDGRADFASNPFNGPVPTYEQTIARLCSSSNVPGCIRRDINSEIPAPDYAAQYSHQASFGVQRQLGSAVGVTADYVYTGTRRDERVRNMNLTYNPATGANYPASDISRRPYPNWGLVLGEFMEGRSNYHALQTAFTKRMNQNWQLAGTYTLSFLKDDNGTPCQIVPQADGPVCEPITFALQPDLGNEYGYAVNDQRHRAVLNGIWQMGGGFQLSGLYFFGSGERRATTFGGDRRNQGGGASGRVRPDGTIVPRNNFVGEPIHRVDMRVMKQFSLGGNRTIEGGLEVFNVFNHENYGSYTTAESNRNYGRPEFNNNNAYRSRSMQLGFRFAF